MTRTGEAWLALRAPRTVHATTGLPLLLGLAKMQPHGCSLTDPSTQADPMPPTQTRTDRIEKKILLRAPRERVWRALTDAAEFGAWFRVKLEGAFEAGKHVRGRVTYPGYEHLTFDVLVERIEPERLFSFRWHPAAVEPAVDYSKEPTTLVEFRLEEAKDGTWLTVVESGFDKLPAARRDEAFRMNSGGWSTQMENVRQHVGG